jgi:hypothetical protein
MIRWREHRRRPLRLIAALLVALLAAQFLAGALVPLVGLAYAEGIGGIAFVIVAAILVFRLAGREPHEPYDSE